MNNQQHVQDDQYQPHVRHLPEEVYFYLVFVSYWCTVGRCLGFVDVLQVVLGPEGVHFVFPDCKESYQKVVVVFQTFFRWFWGLKIHFAVPDGKEPHKEVVVVVQASFRCFLGLKISLCGFRRQGSRWSWFSRRPSGGFRA